MPNCLHQYTGFVREIFKFDKNKYKDKINNLNYFISVVYFTLNKVFVLLIKIKTCNNITN